MSIWESEFGSKAVAECTPYFLAHMAASVSIMGGDLAQNCLNMNLNRSFCNTKFARDDLIWISDTQAVEHFKFSRGQLIHDRVCLISVATEAGSIEFMPMHGTGNRRSPRITSSRDLTRTSQLSCLRSNALTPAPKALNIKTSS